MKVLLSVIVVLTVVLTFVACSQNPARVQDNSEADAKSLRAAEEAAIAAFGSKDVDRMVAAYSADASLTLTDSPLLKGEELKAALKSLATDPNFSMQFRTDKVEVAKGGGLGYTRGAYTLTTSDPKSKGTLREVGKYVTIYAKQADGGWKIIEDIANADAPATHAAGKH